MASSNPYLSSAGEYIFRLSPISLTSADVLSEFAHHTLRVQRVALVYEEGDYPRPVAERFAENMKRRGAEIVAMISVLPEDTDYRSVVTRLKASNPEAVYIGAQSTTAATLIVEEMKRQNVTTLLLGNEVAGNAAFAEPTKAPLFEGIYYAEPPLDRENELTAQFIRRFNAKYHTSDLPHGIWTIEPYDAVKLLAKTIGECGDEVEKVKACLYRVQDYHGASGVVGINAQGDGIRQYAVKRINGGKSVFVR